MSNSHSPTPTCSMLPASLFGSAVKVNFVSSSEESIENFNLIFCFDIACPYAYIASQRLPAWSAELDVSVLWRPVLLGGLYKLDKAAQGAAGSASDAMPAVKRAVSAADLFRQAERFQVPLRFHPRHPLRSLNAMRILASISSSRSRMEIANYFYQAYWVRNENIDSLEFLHQACDKFHVSKDVIQRDETKQKLEENTNWAFQHGAFGVPAFFLPLPKSSSATRYDYQLPVEMPSLLANDTRRYELFWGNDRMHFLRRYFQEQKASASGQRFQPHPIEQLQRVLEMPKPISDLSSSTPLVEFYFDFSSPWAFIGYSQLHFLQSFARIRFIPLLLGALFKDIGTPNVPMAAVTESKRRYGMKDMNDWINWWKLKFQWPSVFPIRTVLPLRIVLAEKDDTQRQQLIDLFFKAAWQEDINIGDENLVKELVSKRIKKYSSSVALTALFDSVNSAEVKEQLKANTESAVKLGVCGVPTFIVHRSDSDEAAEMLWGQDHLDVVFDLLAGWKRASKASAAKL